MNCAKYTALMLLLLIAGCGYYNPYVARSDSKPITLHRSMWKNSTTELALETTFYRALSDWLRKSTLITMTETRDEAEYILTGEITRIDYPEISYGSQQSVKELRADLTIHFLITNNKTGAIVWEKTETQQQELFMSSDPITLRNNKNVALAQIADDVAEEIYLHIINSIMRPAEEVLPSMPPAAQEDATTK